MRGLTALRSKDSMKTALYVATVARTYRKAIDDYLEDPENFMKSICRGTARRLQAVPTVSLRPDFFYGRAG